RAPPERAERAAARGRAQTRASARGDRDAGRGAEPWGAGADGAAERGGVSQAGPLAQLVAGLVRTGRVLPAGSGQRRRQRRTARVTRVLSRYSQTSLPLRSNSTARLWPMLVTMVLPLASRSAMIGCSTFTSHTGWPWASYSITLFSP